MIKKSSLLVLGFAVQATVIACSSLQVDPGQVDSSRAELPDGDALAAAEAQPAAASQSHYDTDVAPLLSKYCVSCHSGADAPAAVRLDFGSEEEAREKAATELDFWSRVARNVSAEQMPPPYAPIKPTEAERAVLVDWINSNVLTANGKPDPGPFMVRRMNNREYANTLRDLLYLPADHDASADFPADERGSGFDNNSGTLTISPLLIESYLRAAEKATVTALGLDPAVMAAADSAAEAQIDYSQDMLNAPSEGVRLDFSDWQEAVRLNLEVFAPRAFRRPVTDAEIEELMKFAALSFAHNGESRNAATGLAIRAALLSPEFLFRLESDPNPDGTGKVFELTEYQLASRLSYFLWSTMPDDSLFIAARDGTLRSNLEVHIARMLADPKANSLTKDFLGQWLEIRSLEEVPNADSELLASMKGETEHFFDYIVREDRSIMDFLEADYTFVDERLAELYEIPGVTGDAFQRVEVDGTQRGGIFTQASILTLTSKPLGDSRRTSPVVRGKWILENIFNETIPPPPPNVPEALDTNKELKGTVRQIFEQHRADPVCAGCHARMDPYGFALENYDGFGGWREQDNNVDVDASGEINGRKFTGPMEFREILASRKDDFRRAMVRKMLSYALGRGILGSDRATIDEITSAVEGDGDRFSSLILNIVKSYPFQNARGSAARTAEPPTWASAPPEELYHAVSNRPKPEPEPEPERRRRPDQNEGQRSQRERPEEAPAQAPEQTPAPAPAAPTTLSRN